MRLHYSLYLSLCICCSLLGGCSESDDANGVKILVKHVDLGETTSVDPISRSVSLDLEGFFSVDDEPVVSASATSCSCVVAESEKDFLDNKGTLNVRFPWNADGVRVIRKAGFRAEQAIEIRGIIASKKEIPHAFKLVVSRTLTLPVHVEEVNSDEEKRQFAVRYSSPTPIAQPALTITCSGGLPVSVDRTIEGLLARVDVGRAIRGGSFYLTIKVEEVPYRYNFNIEPPELTVVPKVAFCSPEDDGVTCLISYYSALEMRNVRAYEDPEKTEEFQVRQLGSNKLQIFKAYDSVSDNQLDGEVELTLEFITKEKILHRTLKIITK